VVSLLDCKDCMGYRNVAVVDFRKRMEFAEMVVVVRKDIEAVEEDAIVVFVDKDIVVEILVDWDWEILGTDAMYSVVYFPMVVVRKFDLDQQEGDYYSDSSTVD
jgi:hypothetical protein